MYNPGHFAEERPEVLASFIDTHPLAIVATSGAEGPDATHVPMVLHRESGEKGVLRFHLARANPHWNAIASGIPVLAIFAGAEHYITPLWYPSTGEHGKVVPTWNYITVHVRGKGRAMADEELMAHLRELTKRNEQPFEEPWTVDSAPQDYIKALTKAIVGLEIRISSIEGKWKASQNRTAPDRDGVISGLKALNTPESVEMSEIVRESNERKTHG